MLSTSVYARYVDVTTGCRWQLHRPGERQELLLTFVDHRLPYSIAEEDGRLFLWQYVGDPDAWKYMEFTR